MPRPLAALLTSAALVVALLALPAAGAGWPAQPPATGQVEVVLDRVTPSTATPDSALSVTGTLRNEGTAPVPVQEVRATTAYRGLDTRGLVASWAEGTSQVSTRRELGADEVDAALAPGAAVGFRIQVEAGVVDPPFDFATLPLLLSVTGPEGQEVGELRTYLPWDGQTDYDHHPLATAVLLPLGLPPDPALLVPPDSSREAAWSELAGPGSALVGLLEDLGDDPVSFLVDPALVAPALPPASLAAPPGGPTPPEQTPTGESPTSTPGPTGPAPATATPSPGTDVGGTTEDPAVPDGPDDQDPTSPPGEPDPTDPPEGGPDSSPGDAFRTALEAVDEQRLWWLPYGDPDLAALQELDAGDDVLAGLLGGPAAAATEDPATATAAPDVTDGGTGPAAALGRGGRGVAWPVWTSPTDDDVTDLVDRWGSAGGGLEAVVVPSGVLPGGGGLTPTAATRHPSGVTLLGYDEEVSALVAGAGPAEQHGAALQRVLAETLAVYQERPATDRELLIALPRGSVPDARVLTDLLRTLDEASWLRATGVGELLGRATADDPVSLPPAAAGEGGAPAEPGPAAYPDPGTSPLTPARLGALGRIDDNLVGAGQIVPEGQVRAAAWSAVLDQALSVRWRQRPGAWPVPVDAARAVSREVLTGVRVNPTTINFLADEGLIQLTVTNTLPVEVRDLRVTLTPRNPRLRVVEQPEPLTVGPGSRATVQFRARALAAGEVEVETVMTAPDGTTVGRTQVMQVRVQPTGSWIYWVLGGAAGIILVLGLWRALRPRPAAEPAGDDATEDEGEP